MLPFGLTTDVSAGALAAGAGAALGPGAAGAVMGNGLPGSQQTGFAQELQAVTTQGTPQPVGGEAAPAEGALEALPLLKQAADAAKPAGPLPAPADTASAETTDASLLKTEAASEPDVADADDQEAAGDLAGEITLASIAPAHMNAVPSFAPGPVDGAAPQAITAPAGLAAAAAAASGLPSPANGPQAGGAGFTPSAAPVAQGAAAGSSAASAQAAVPGAGAQTPLVTPPAAQAGRAAETPVAPIQQTAPQGRRWQTELPQEFRAPPLTVPVQSSTHGAQPTATQLPAVAVATAAGGPAVPQAPSILPQAGAPGTDATAPLLPQAAASQQPVTAQQPPLADTLAPQQPQADQAGAAAKPAAAGTPATGAVATAPATASTQSILPAQNPVVAAAAGEGLLPPAADGAPAPDPVVDPVPGPVSGVGPGKPAPAGTAQATSAKQAPAGGVSTPSQTDVRQGPAVSTSVAAAVPLAAALAAGDDAELPLTPLEAAAGTEFSAATVRGGDMSGAMRTESLQTPNQAQSTHVATQVAAEIVRNLKNGQTHFQMRFDPPELGRVEVNMRVASDGSVQAHLIVDRPETLDMFLRDQRGLERALEAAGLNPDSNNLQFSLKQDGGQDMAGDRENQPGSGGADESASDGAGELDPDVSERVRLMLAEQRGGLDMKV